MLLETIHHFVRKGELKLNYLKHLSAFIPRAFGEGGRKRDCIIWSLYTTIYGCLNMVNNLCHTFSFCYSLQVPLKFTRNVSACENNRWIILFTVREGYYLNFTTRICQQTLAMLWNSPAALLRPLLMEGCSELWVNFVMAPKDDTELSELAFPPGCVLEYFCFIYFSAFLSSTSISHYSPPVFPVAFYSLFIGCINNVLALCKYPIST